MRANDGIADQVSQRLASEPIPMRGALKPGKAGRGKFNFQVGTRSCENRSAEAGREARGDGASTDSAIDRPRNVPLAPPPHGTPDA